MNSSPFRVVQLAGRGATFACDLPGPSPSAPVIVLLHGLFATGNLNWSPYFDDLTEHYRVVAIDHRGHGRGIVGDEPFTLETCADDVAALLEGLRIKEAILVGYSMGGPIAQLLWHRHPDVVRGLVLCATAGHFGRTPIDHLVAPLVHSAGRALMMLPALLRPVIAGPALSVFLPDSNLKANVAAALAQHDPVSIRAAIQSTLGYSSIDWLPEISVPTAVVVTERDRVVPPRRQRQLVAHIHGATTFGIDADHLACFDDVDTFGEALLAACADVARRSAATWRRPLRRLRAAWRAWRSGRRAGA